MPEASLISVTWKDGDHKSDNDRNAEQGDGQADETRDESAGRVEHDTSTAQQTDGAEDAASGDTAENQEEEVGETSRIVIEISVVFLTFYFIFFCNKKFLTTQPHLHILTVTSLEI